MVSQRALHGIGHRSNHRYRDDALGALGAPPRAAGRPGVLHRFRRGPEAVPDLLRRKPVFSSGAAAEKAQEDKAKLSEKELKNAKDIAKAQAKTKTRTITVGNAISTGLKIAGSIAAAYGTYKKIANMVSDLTGTDLPGVGDMTLSGRKEKDDGKSDSSGDKDKDKSDSSGGKGSPLTADAIAKAVVSAMPKSESKPSVAAPASTIASAISDKETKTMGSAKGYRGMKWISKPAADKTTSSSIVSDIATEVISSPKTKELLTSPGVKSMIKDVSDSFVKGLTTSSAREIGAGKTFADSFGDVKMDSLGIEPGFDPWDFIPDT